MKKIREAAVYRKFIEEMKRKQRDERRNQPIKSLPTGDTRLCVVEKIYEGADVHRNW